MNFEKKTLNDFFLVRFKSGDKLAFESIFKEKFPQIVGFCRQFIDNKNEADGIAQEAFVNLWLKREKIEKLTGIDSFLYTF